MYLNFQNYIVTFISIVLYLQYVQEVSYILKNSNILIIITVFRQYDCIFMTIS